MSRTGFHGALVALISLTTAACSEDSNDTADGGSEDRVTYYNDVLPLFNEHCVSCHTEGGLAPFAVDDYEDAKAWATSITAATASRTMPPWGVDNSGSCNEFTDARWLEDDEIAILEAWVQDGMLEGDASAEIPDPPTPPILAGNDIVDVTTPMYMPVGEADGGGLEDYQCFLVDMNQDSDRYLVGFDVIPGNDRTVHHVLGFKVNPGIFNNEKTMQDLDDASPDQIGWDCFGAAGENVIVEGVPVTWAPGTGATMFPEGTGIPLRADDMLVVQVHYNLANENGPDETQIRLSFTDEVERPAVQVLWDPFLYASVLGSPEFIAPGKESVEYKWSDTIATMTGIADAESVEVWGLLPHMHKRGRTMTIDFDTDAGMTCGARVDAWDFDWQQSYFLEQPLTVGLDQEMHVSCNWNTMQDTAPIQGGFGTKDEMCLVGLYVVPN